MSELGGARAAADRLPTRAAAAAVAGCGLAVASCSLILDFSGTADAPDAGLADATAVSACERFEPNDTLAEAQPLDAGTYALGICDGDTADFFAFDLPDAATLRVELSFEEDVGRSVLDLRLIDRTTQGEIGIVNSTGGEAILERSPAQGNALAAGAYAIEIFVSPSVTDQAPEILYDLVVNY
jgi:hypothetical protein